MLKKLNNLVKFNDVREKKGIVLLLSFLLPFVITVTILVIKRVFPFGDRCILRTDFYHQYFPFHTELNYKLQSFRSLFYTYDVGLGTNFITLFSYYLSCPFNILLFFVNRNYVLEFMTIMIILKISLSGLTMAYYLHKRYKSDSFVIVLISIFYSLSGYVGAYYWNIMWLNNIVLFPLLMLGFENVYNGKKPYLYIVTLALSILCNYYIGTITCIFLIIYFIFYSIYRNIRINKIFINLLHIALYSIVGVLISSILLVPVIYAFNTTASSGSTFPTTAKEYFTIMEALSRHLPLTKAENGIEYWPNLYSGMICFPLIIMYFLSKKYAIREKICYAVLLIFFIASFSINYLDFIWHIFKYPNSLPCRQSFIYTFILLTIIMKPLLKFKSIKPNHIYISFVASIVLILVSHKTLETEKVPFYSIYAALILLLMYMVIFIKFKEKRANKNVLLYISIIVISLEAAINMYSTSLLTIKRDDYIKNTMDIREVVNDIKKLTDDFYRVERVSLKTKDDGAFLNFPSNSIFSSSAYKEGSDFYKAFGMEASTNAYSVTGSTPFMDSLLSVKYKIYEKKPEVTEEVNIREISNVNEVYLYQNIDTMPLSFVLQDDFLEKYDKTSGNPATVQNNFSRTMNLGTMLDKVDVTINGKDAKLKVKESGDYYAFVRDKGIKEVTVSFDTTSNKFKNLNRGYFIELGYLEKDKEYEFRNDTNDSELLIEVFRFDFDTFKKVINNLKSNSDFKLNKWTDTYLKYDLDVKKDGTSVISLPYDEGFTIKVDGNVIEKEKVLDLFLGFKTTKGKHVVELSYMPRGFILGCLLSLSGILILLAMAIKEKVGGKLLFK